MDFKHLSTSKICLIYVYYERKNCEKNQTNLSFFINYGLNKSLWENLDITTVFVLNGRCEVVIPKSENIIVLQNNTSNYSDYEGWRDGILHLCNLHNRELWENYDYLCLMNCGTCGPFMEASQTTHWLYPFYEKMQVKKAVASSPYCNVVDSYALSCHFSFIKITNDIMKLLMCTPIGGSPAVLTAKRNKTEAIDTGEFGLSQVLLNSGYNICCLFYNDIRNECDKIRREFKHETNDTILKNTIFIKNVWRENNGKIYASKPVLYNFCKTFINEKLKYKNIFDDLLVEYNYNKLNNEYTNARIDINKEDYYKNYGFAEEDVIFPKKGDFTHSCVIYAHYDDKNIIANYVIEGLKTLIYLGYDVLFYTASKEIINYDLSILPFHVNFIENSGPGTDWKIFLNGLKKIKTENLNYEWIMIMNDSLLFPINGIQNLTDTINDMRYNSDFWSHWQSNEHSRHLIGVPIEFKIKLVDCALEFIQVNIVNCKNREDNISLLETKFSQNFLNNGYRCKSVFEESEYIMPQPLYCPSHNPYILNQWVNNPKAFAIKWKYSISYLNNESVSAYFNYLTKYLHYGPSGTISCGEIVGSFPSSAHFEIKKN